MRTKKKKKRKRISPYPLRPKVEWIVRSLSRIGHGGSPRSLGIVAGHGKMQHATYLSKDTRAPRCPLTSLTEQIDSKVPGVRTPQRNAWGSDIMINRGRGILFQKLWIADPSPWHAWRLDGESACAVCRAPGQIS